MPVLVPKMVTAVGITVEQALDRGMIDHLVAVVMHQIMLADISDIIAFGIFGEEMVEGLILCRANILRDGLIPFLAVGEDGIDVENHPPKLEQPMPHDIADRKARVGNGRGIQPDRGGGGTPADGYAFFNHKG
jgi:hypothetical protein